MTAQTQTNPAAGDQTGDGDTDNENQYQNSVPGPFAARADEIVASGLGHPLPLPYGRKTPPPPGYTGAEGLTPSGADLAEWAAHRGADNIALRWARDVVGIDRDDHKGHEAAATIEALEDAGGPLPATWRITSRDDGSGISLYRLPEGADESTLTDPGPGVELLRYGHRYAVGPGSVHPEGRVYRVLGPDGQECEHLPHRDDLPALTEAHVAALTRTPPTAPSAVPRDLDEAISEAPERARARLTAWVRNAGDQLDAEVLTLAQAPEGATVEVRGRMMTWETPAPGGAATLAARALRLDSTLAALGLETKHVTTFVEAFAAAGERDYAATKIRNDRDHAIAQGPALPSSWSAWVAEERAVEHLSTPSASLSSAPSSPDPLEVASSSEDAPADEVRERFPTLDLAALVAANRPPREWVVRGLIPAGAACSLVAPAGTGKSLFLLALAVDLVRGRRDFAGLALPRQRRVFLIDLENTEDDLADRLRALGITPDNAHEISDLGVIHLPPLAPLDSLAGGLELAAIIDAYQMTPADVVVLDSMQRVTQGAENDSDTFRDFYRHTGLMLKRRGLTVIRTDNTGKDAEKGARGSSGKRDDVDVELILTRDAEKADRLRIKPGKVRLPGVEPVAVRRVITDDGRLSFTTEGDPFRAAIAHAHAVLDDARVPHDAGEPRALAMIHDAKLSTPTRRALREALAERKNAFHGVAESVLARPLSADQRGGGGEPSTLEGEKGDFPPENEGSSLSTDERKAGGKVSTRAPAVTSPPPPPYRGGEVASTGDGTGKRGTGRPSKGPVPRVVAGRPSLVDLDTGEVLDVDEVAP